MAIAEKVVLLREVEKDLGSHLTVDNMSIVMRTLSDKLSDYELTQSSTSDTSMEQDDMLDAFLEAKTIEGRSIKTIERYRYIITLLMNYASVSTRNITVYHIRSYIMACKNRGLSDRTLEGYRNVFSSYFGWLWRENLIERNPCANLGPIKYLKAIREPYSDVDIERMKECCKCLRDKTIISFLLSTGCRISEACSVNIDDIDFHESECTVIGKGNKQRIVYIDPISNMFLRRYLTSRKDNNPALFIGKGTERMHPGGVRFMLKKLETTCGVPNIHPHRFRRTLATNLINRGMTIQEVASILGHDNINTTMTYVYIDKANVKNAYMKYAS